MNLGHLFPDFHGVVPVQEVCDKFKQLHTRKMIIVVFLLLISMSNNFSPYENFNIKWRGVTCHPIHPPGSGGREGFPSSPQIELD